MIGDEAKQYVPDKPSIQHKKHKRNMQNQTSTDYVLVSPRGPDRVESGLAYLGSGMSLVVMRRARACAEDFWSVPFSSSSVMPQTNSFQSYQTTDKTIKKPAG